MRKRSEIEEILAIFLFVGSEQRYTQIKEIHSFAKEYLLDWFPGLISYQTFVYRLNRMVGAVQELLKHLIVSYKPDDCDDGTLIVDSMPIMTYCGRNRHGKVAHEIVLYSTSENDLMVFKRECVPAIACKIIFADKIYRDNPYWNNERDVKNNELLTPIKAIKGQPKKRNRGIRPQTNCILLLSLL